MCELTNASINAIVPNGYWKVVSVEEGGEVKMVSFMFKQNTARKANFCDYQQNLDFIEQSTGVNFFPGMKGSPSQSEILINEIGC